MYYIKVNVVLLLCTFCILNSSQAQMTNPYIYRLRIKGGGNQKSILQTGFQLKGTHGIITCLHGVLEGIDISADNGTKQIYNLSIKMVDVANDLALLNSPGLSNGIEGLTKSNFVPSEYLPVKVLGYPSGVFGLNEKSITIGKPTFEPLNYLISNDSREILNDRKSPLLSNSVFYLDGILTQGHSGAPLLSADYSKIYGVIDGGINNAGISWAIPIYNIHWQDRNNVTSRLTELKSAKYNSLFAYEDYTISDNWNPLTEPLKRFFRDADNDNYGDSTVSTFADTKPEGYVSNNSDCCDNDKLIYDRNTTKVYYKDGDVDGYGNPNIPITANIDPSTERIHYVTNNTDCDDLDSLVHPNQINFFPGKSKGGTYDYNCDRNIELRWMYRYKIIKNSVSVYIASGIYGTCIPGWYLDFGHPAAGDSAPFVDYAFANGNPHIVMKIQETR